MEVDAVQLRWSVHRQSEPMTLFQDTRFGARLLVRSPGFTAMALFSLALGIGGSTAIFSAVNAVLIRPLPYPQSERLVGLWETSPSVRIGSVSGPNFHDWETQNAVFESMAAVSFSDLSLTGTGEPERVVGAKVSKNFFRVFGIEPGAGRAFLTEEQEAGRDAVVILSHALWQRRFDSDPEIIGKTISLNGRMHTVIGVTPEHFRYAATFGLLDVNLWLPLGLQAEQQPRGNHGFQVYGRLKPGVQLEQASAEMQAIAGRLADQYPEQKERTVRLIPLKEQFTSRIRPALLLLLGTVALVLLIACANVAGLLLSLGASRQGEFSVRLALGASPWRLKRQVLTESVLLGLLGGLLGILVALWGVDLLKLGLAEKISRVLTIEVDTRVLLFSVTLSVVSSVLFGLWPATQASRTNLHGGLKEGAARATTGPQRVRARRMLVVSELALAMSLLVTAGLMIRSFANLTGVDPGFDAKGLLTVRLALPDAKYAGRDHVALFYKQVLEQLRTVPGVVSVGIVNDPPLSHINVNGDFSIEGRPPWKPGERPVTEYLSVSADYFRTMGMAIIKGRGFSEYDTQDSKPVVIINEAMARRFWPNEDPIGKRMQIDWAGEAPLEIVGIVREVKRWGLDDAGGTPESYVPHPQRPVADMAIMVRTAGDPLQFVLPVRDQVRKIDPDQPLYDVKTMEQVVAGSIGERQFNVVLLSLFSVIALILASVGIYGLMSYQVTSRTQELGIRMALGARAQDVQRLILKEGTKLAFWGLSLGLIGTLTLSRVLRGLLYGVEESDPITFAVVTLLLASVALLATYLPARRASRINPMVALRSE